MKILWAVTNNQALSGGGYGYGIHRQKMIEAMRDIGASVTTDRDDRYDLAVHIVPPGPFRPIEGTRNLLFTMVEHSAPIEWGACVSLADVLVTPCTHSRSVLQNHFPGPIEVCPEGIDSDRFPFTQRSAPVQGAPFRVLFNGTADSIAKGSCFSVHALRTWITQGQRPDDFQLVIKTTTTREGIPGISMRPRFPVEYYHADPNNPNGLIGPIPPCLYSSIYSDIPALVIDTRNLPSNELLGLYQSSHAFILPSCGEGWGLTLTEAMATGLPCAWTHATAALDYADESIGFPLYHLEPVPFWHPYHDVEKDPPDYIGVAPLEEDIIEAFTQIYEDYPAALERGRRASERMHTQYTWRQAAEKFLEICKRYA